LSSAFTLRRCLSPLEREQACDIRRSVLCGELHMGREAARDADDETAHLVLALAGEKPVGTARLVPRGGLQMLEHVSVLPQYRRQGLGRQMVGYFARSAGADLLAVAPSPGLAFFLASGFLVEKEDPPVFLLRRKA
jgi:GNAT superfamily N-acetyltransferase